MVIVYVPDFDEDGNDIGYTESQPEPYVKEEPDCYGCNDAGCPECDGSQVNPSETFTLTNAGWPPSGGTWGGYSDEPPF